MSEEPPNIYERISNGINSAVDPGEFVTKWVTIVEIVDLDGDKGVYLFDSQESAPWDVLGLLEFAKQKALTKVDMATWIQHTITVEEDEEE